MKDHEHIDIPVIYEDYKAYRCVVCRMVRIPEIDDCNNEECVFHGLTR